MASEICGGSEDPPITIVIGATRGVARLQYGNRAVKKQLVSGLDSRHQFHIVTPGLILKGEAMHLVHTILFRVPSPNLVNQFLLLLEIDSFLFKVQFPNCRGQVLYVGRLFQIFAGAKPNPFKGGLNRWMPA